MARMAWMAWMTWMAHMHACHAWHAWHRCTDAMHGTNGMDSMDGIDGIIDGIDGIDAMDGTHAHGMHGTQQLNQPCIPTPPSLSCRLTRRPLRGLNFPEYDCAARHYRNHRPQFWDSLMDPDVTLRGSVRPPHIRRKHHLGPKHPTEKSFTC